MCENRVRVTVHVDDGGAGDDRPRGLMHVSEDPAARQYVPGHWQARAEVKELADVGCGQPGHGGGHETPVDLAEALQAGGVPAVRLSRCRTGSCSDAVTPHLMSSPGPPPEQPA
jgi:hypothetical protein